MRVAWIASLALFQRTPRICQRRASICQPINLSPPGDSGAIEWFFAGTKSPGFSIAPCSRSALRQMCRRVLGFSLTTSDTLISNALKPFQYSRRHREDTLRTPQKSRHHPTMRWLAGARTPGARPSSTAPWGVPSPDSPPNGRTPIQGLFLIVRRVYQGISCSS